MRENLSKEKDFAIRLARKAGKIIKENFKQNVKIDLKEDSTPLTETDKRINQLAIDSVKKEFPGYSILAEEGSFFVKDSEYTWVCDPMDGTIAFSCWFPLSTFVLALTKNGESILGVIYDPFMNRMFVAEKGKGAFLNGKKIRVSKTKEFNKSVMGLATRKKHKFDLAPVLKSLKEENIFQLTLGSAAYTGILIACGKLDGYINSTSNPYEAAALKIIVEEAGGKVTNLFGKEQGYDGKINGFIISNGVLHNKILKLVKKSIG